MAFQVQHVTHESPESDRQAVLRFSSGDYLWATRSRFEAPWGDEVYGIVGAFEGELCVGTTSYTISRRGQGILSQVFTDPDYRGQGIATAVVRETVETYRRRRARAVYLAAWREWVREIYRKAGFVLVGTMGERHAFKLTLDPSGEDASLFRAGQRTGIRPMGAGDQADLSSLFNAAHPGVVKHYGLGCFLGSHFEGEFVTLRRQVDLEGLRAVTLDGEETILGLATVMPSARRHEGYTWILDFLVHPNYASLAPGLIDAAEQGSPLERLRAFAAVSDIQKRKVLEGAGYRRVVRLEQHLKVGTGYHDLEMYEKIVSH